MSMSGYCRERPHYFIARRHLNVSIPRTISPRGAPDSFGLGRRRLIENLIIRDEREKHQWTSECAVSILCVWKSRLSLPHATRPATTALIVTNAYPDAMPQSKKWKNSASCMQRHLTLVFPIFFVDLEETRHECDALRRGNFPASTA